MFITFTQPNGQAISINPDRVIHYAQAPDDPTKTIVTFDSLRAVVILLSAANVALALATSGIDVIDTDQIAFPEKQQ